MSSTCCSTDEGGACALPTAKPGFCPACVAKGRAVATLTVKSLVRDHARVPADASFSFCRTPECDVVYFSDAALFYKQDVKVRVGLKETEEPVPLCYCFDYSRADIRRDVEETGNTEIPARIKAEVQGGFCACEVKNPAGVCCLGAITRAVQQATSSLSTRSG